MDFAEIELTESQFWIELPVLIKYNFVTHNRNRIPFINAGGSVQYLISATADVERKDNTADSSGRALDDRIDVSDLRNKLNYNAIIGAGIKLKNVLGKGYIIIEGRYTHGLRNIVNPAKRAQSLSDSDLVYNFLHIDNDFTLNTFAIFIGYTIPQYKPKILRKKQEL